MNKLKIVVIMLAIANVVGCSKAMLDEQPKNEQLAKIFKHHISDGFITFSTVGYGCTFYNNFKIEASDKQSNTLEIVKISPDNCNMAPRDVSLVYSFRHLGLDLKRRVYVKNAISTAKLNNLAAK